MGLVTQVRRSQRMFKSPSVIIPCVIKVWTGWLTQGIGHLELEVCHYRSWSRANGLR